MNSRRRQLVECISRTSMTALKWIWREISSKRKMIRLFTFSLFSIMKELRNDLHLSDYSQTLSFLILQCLKLVWEFFTKLLNNDVRMTSRSIFKFRHLLFWLKWLFLSLQRQKISCNWKANHQKSSSL